MQAHPEAGDYGAIREVLAAPDDPRFAHLAWPKLARSGDGTLLIACCAGRAHNPADGEASPAVALSTNDGADFTAPRVLIELGRDRPMHHCGNLALGAAADGALVLVAMGMTTDSRATAIFALRSEDGGRTWTTCDTAALSGRGGSVYGHVFPVPGRGLAVAGHLRRGAALGEHGIWLAFSKDDGRSWGAPEIISRDRLAEPAFVCVGDRVIGLVREQDREQRGGYRMFVSEDSGRTWRDAPSGVGEGPDLPSPFLAADPARPGTLYALQTDRDREGRIGHGSITLWTATVDGLVWRQLGCVATFPLHEGVPRPDYGYPWMVPAGEGEWCVVFYCGAVRGPCSIWGLRLNLP